MDYTNHRRAQRCIAQGYLTNSKRPRSHVFGVVPTHIKGARGCYLFGDDNRKWLDFVCGLGTNLLGYGHEQIASEVAQAYRDGNSPSLATTYELDCGEKLKEFFPWVDCWKFFKTGTEACMAATRIARAMAGNRVHDQNVFCEGYHGWSDEFVSLTEPALGIPEVDDCYYHFMADDRPCNHEICITEPVITTYNRERIEELKAYREKYKVQLTCFKR